MIGKPKTPVNVILLYDTEQEKRESIIEAYADMASDCETKDEWYSLFEMMYEEIWILSAESILKKQITKNAEILEDIKNNF